MFRRPRQPTLLVLVWFLHTSLRAPRDDDIFLMASLSFFVAMGLGENFYSISRIFFVNCPFVSTLLVLKTLSLIT